MEMFLTVLCLSLLGVGVSAIAFGAATRDVRLTERVEPVQPRPMVKPASQFFVAAPPVSDAPVRVPLEVILLRLESHVRLEQAAAESFLAAPTLESLHTRTASPLIH